MSQDLFNEIFDTDAIDTNAIPDPIIERSPVKHQLFLYRKDSIRVEVDTVFPGCVIYIDKYNACKGNWKLRAYCAHKGCRKYLLTAKYLNPRNFTIKSLLHASFEDMKETKICKHSRLYVRRNYLKRKLILLTRQLLY